MNIIFVSPECFPFAKEGSLAELVAYLSRGIEKPGHNVKIFMPRYGCIDPVQFHIERLPIDFKVTYKGSLVSASVYKGILPDSLVSIFFIESQIHFSNSKEIYSTRPQDVDRFSFFSSSIPEIISKLKIDVDVLHLFNPESTELAFILKSNKSSYPGLNKVPIIFTINNIRDFSQSSIENIVHGINYSSFVTTVSSSYASELLEDHKINEISAALQKKQDFFCGILSGIDENIYNPETDKDIAQTYSKSYFSIGKRKCKEELLKIAALDKDFQLPVFAISTEGIENESINLITDAIPHISSLPVLIIILAKGNELERYTATLSRLKNVKILTCPDYSLTNKLLAGSDFLISINKTEPDGVIALKGMRYGCVPIAYETGAIKEIITDGVNGIVFKTYTTHEFIEKVDIALKQYKNKETWTRLIKEAMNFSLNTGEITKQYLKCYEGVAGVLSGQNPAR